MMHDTIGTDRCYNLRLQGTFLACMLRPRDGTPNESLHYSTNQPTNQPTNQATDPECSLWPRE